MAEELAETSRVSMSAGNNISVVTPEFDTMGQSSVQSIVQLVWMLNLFLLFQIFRTIKDMQRKIVRFAKKVRGWMEL